MQSLADRLGASERVPIGDHGRVSIAAAGWSSSLVAVRRRWILSSRIAVNSLFNQLARSIATKNPGLKIEQFKRVTLASRASRLMGTTRRAASKKDIAEMASLAPRTRSWAPIASKPPPGAIHWPGPVPARPEPLLGPHGPRYFSMRWRAVAHCAGAERGFRPIAARARRVIMASGPPQSVDSMTAMKGPAQADTGAAGSD
ncbi:hypothetical protein PHYSODRAFT_303242 [Phytophthora sojae]|uniref:Uncharacterized protein n=1 Tax=Phytophthora sojae (strain P6497) TaxID=1094619 RepID=G4ZRP0_PHYSP|nr:hypothetical protein PHYSODRAFT_303242 [Phytophthora sojae]EGZ13849.1 hypothetical protein PHYSODRAFT_303242 [Phytophthora sojae]|eukprot:XP_009531278.1 hypothetical protein PHYSODRAFT_303242 [Phytophthora sojae]